MSVYNDKTILITGGTGSFGTTFVHELLTTTTAKKIIIFSRDEFKQHSLEHHYASQPEYADRLRFFLGDVRDADRLKRAFRGIDIVVHAAALKQVPALEYNPSEAIKTNIIGTQNVIDAAVDAAVPKVLLISTDKACQPINLYGASKLCAEKLGVAGNVYAPGATAISVVRYGNVVGSRGSIVDMLTRTAAPKVVQLTDPAMTRFWITLHQSFKLVTYALEHMEGGEIFVPKIPSMRISDLFDALVPEAEKKITGIRPGEKIHESLVAEHEARHAFDLGDYYVILPEFQFFKEDAYAQYKTKGSALPARFVYASDTNTQWLTAEELRSIVMAKTH